MGIRNHDDLYFATQGMRTRDRLDLLPFASAVLEITGEITVTDMTLAYPWEGRVGMMQLRRRGKQYQLRGTACGSFETRWSDDVYALVAEAHAEADRRIRHDNRLREATAIMGHDRWISDRMGL